MATQAFLRFDRQVIIGDIDPRVKGSFVEHLGRCLYKGLYEPTHPTADAQGFRNDVKALIAELGVTCIRYPGGNFVSGYNWRDGIGPKEKRPVRREMAWNVLETNEVGTDEFARLCREMGVELLMACNMGTGTPKEAGELAEYCTAPGGTALSNERIQNGSAQPYDIHVWCVGNEMDGAWQIEAMTAEGYAHKAREAAKIIRWMDPKAQTVFCGSCTNEIGHESYGAWDQTVLETAYDEIDYLSLHRYFNYHTDKQLFYPMNDDPTDIPYFFRDLDEYISTIVHVCDFVKGKLRKEKQINISFDEWGVVARSGALPGGVEQSFYTAEYSQLDAVIAGGLICKLLSHADRVKIACQSLLVNEGGMITTVPGGPAYRQATYWPFYDLAHKVSGISLRGMGTVPKKQTHHHGENETLISAACYDPEKRRVCVLLANVDTEEDCELTLRLSDFGALKPVSCEELFVEDASLCNTAAEQNRVIPHALALPQMEDDTVRLTVKRHSWQTVEFEVKG